MQYLLGVRNGWRVPLIFVLTTNKTYTTYKKIFETIKKAVPNLNPKQITVDFELAAVKAAKEVFPQSRVQGCHFHLVKNIVKNLGQHGLKVRYETDSRFSAEMRQLSAMAFVPVELVISTWDLFIRHSTTLNPKEQKKHPNVSEFINDYFVPHYIGKPKKNAGRGKPQFPIDLWNVHQSTMDGEDL